MKSGWSPVGAASGPRRGAEPPPDQSRWTYQTAIAGSPIHHQLAAKAQGDR